jgi:hypothetical protein
MAISIPTRAEALAALNSLQGAAESLDLLWGGDTEATRRDGETLRLALLYLPEPVVTHRFWHIGMLEWEECGCSKPAIEHEDWYPLQFH